MSWDPEWSALVVFVPEAEPVVGEYRRRHDTSAAMGVAAHVTVLFPFVKPDSIDDGLLAALADLYADVPAFEARVRSIGRFPGVVYLTPEPAERWRALLAATSEAYPHLPPYEGVHDEVIPHLTVGEVDDPIASALERALAPRLPIAAAVTHIALIAAHGGPSEVVAEFPLAAHLASL